MARNMFKVKVKIKTTMTAPYFGTTNMVTWLKIEEN